MYVFVYGCGLAQIRARHQIDRPGQFGAWCGKSCWNLKHRVKHSVGAHSFQGQLKAYNQNNPYQRALPCRKTTDFARRAPLISDMLLKLRSTRKPHPPLDSEFP